MGEHEVKSLTILKEEHNVLITMGVILNTLKEAAKKKTYNYTKKRISSRND